MKTATPFKTTVIIPPSSTSPFLAFYIQTPEGRLYQVDGKGFSTRNLLKATRHIVDPNIDRIKLAETIAGLGSIHCIAPLFIAVTTTDRVDAAWGNRVFPLLPDDLVAQAWRLVWREVKHLHRGGHPFGPSVRIATIDRNDGGSLFNIEIYPQSGDLGFLHPAADDWDSSPRSIQTHLGLLGFRIQLPSASGNTITLWHRSIRGGEGAIHLETDLGTTIRTLSVQLGGTSELRVEGFGHLGCHKKLQRQLVDLINKLEFANGSPDLRSILEDLFPEPLQIGIDYPTS